MFRFLVYGSAIEKNMLSIAWHWPFPYYGWLLCQFRMLQWIAPILYRCTSVLSILYRYCTAEHRYVDTVPRRCCTGLPAYRYNICSSSFPDCSWNELPGMHQLSGGRQHSELTSLGDCLSSCQAQAPFCSGVDYDPNCWIACCWFTTSLGVVAGTSGWVSHLSLTCRLNDGEGTTTGTSNSWVYGGQLGYICGVGTVEAKATYVGVYGSGFSQKHGIHWCYGWVTCLFYSIRAAWNWLNPCCLTHVA